MERLAFLVSLQVICCRFGLRNYQRRSWESKALHVILVYWPAAINDIVSSVSIHMSTKPIALLCFSKITSDLRSPSIAYVPPFHSIAGFRHVCSGRYLQFLHIFHRPTSECTLSSSSTAPRCTAMWPLALWYPWQYWIRWAKVKPCAFKPENDLAGRHRIDAYLEKVFITVLE